ncbi:hypothetical protein NY547_19055 [Cnuibacter physcomitrellae]|uniref:hypothetical protein n=1 Tax=Cnuibacter physcomitrellae TaxID=1619308 RepID=UPI002175F57A|nr:hypothetical protein [Cnuibacter physcomitrellae]MCS5499346.1 hypothetical protein [Cnuibacter physcomitrellae]
MDPSAEQNATIEAFTTAVFENRFDEALQHASPGSAAERYVTHQKALATGLSANGEGQSDPSTDPTLSFDGDVVTVSQAGTVYTLSDYTFDADGLVTGWTGKSGPVANVLWTQPWSGQAGGNSVELVSAYKANAGTLYVILKVTAGAGTITPNGYSATYSASDGITYSAGGASQPREIAAGSAGYVILTFDGAPFGGTVNFDGTSPDDYSISWAASIPVV